MPPVVKKYKEIDCADKRLHFGCGTFLFWNREALDRKSMEFLMDFGDSSRERYVTNLGQSKTYTYDLFDGRFRINPYTAYKREAAIYVCVCIPIMRETRNMKEKTKRKRRAPRGHKANETRKGKQGKNDKGKAQGSEGKKGKNRETRPRDESESKGKKRKAPGSKGRKGKTTERKGNVKG